MSTFSEAASVLREAGKELHAATRAATIEATALMEAGVRVGQGRAGAASGRLRGVGQRGARIGVLGTVRGNSGLVRATGPAHLLDHLTKPHTITARRGQVLTLPAIGTEKGRPTSVNHPGTAGKLYFEEAVAEVTQKIPAIYDRHTAAVLLKAASA